MAIQDLGTFSKTFPGSPLVRQFKVELNTQTGSTVTYDVTAPLQKDAVFRDEPVTDSTGKKQYRTTIIPGIDVSAYGRTSADVASYLASVTNQSNQIRAQYYINNAPQTGQELRIPGAINIEGRPNVYDPLNTGTPLNFEIPTQISNEDIQSYFGSENTIIKYPTNLGSNEQDYIEFSLVDYGKRPFQAPNQEGFNIGTRDLEILQNPKIYLPIQPSINDQNDIGWGEEKMTAFQTIFANIATKGDGQTITSEMDKIMNVFGSGRYADTLRRYIGGQAVGINPIARTDGLVLNPNLELLFSGPSLRPFNFTFRLSPRDKTEADIVKNIIKFFKLGSTVRTTADGLFLKAPYVFNIRYIFNKKNSAQDHPGLNRIKKCALRTISVNYTPDGSYMTFEDGTMTSYEISLQFCELEPVYDSDYARDNNINHAIGY